MLGTGKALLSKWERREGKGGQIVLAASKKRVKDERAEELGEGIPGDGGDQ